MANYKKPQSPLQHKDGDYFYPLTTVDQIIVDDNTRLNSKLDHILTVDFSDAGNADATGVNADTLGGYAADEYAKAATIDNMLEIDLYGATAGEPNLVDADTLGGFGLDHFASVEEMNGKLSMELLWENASPTSSFAEQTIALDLSKYRFIRVYFYPTSTGAKNEYHQELDVGSRTVLVAWNYILSKGESIIAKTRQISANEDSIVFNTARSKVVTSTSPTDDNTGVIPFAIYGIK